MNKKKIFKVGFILIITGAVIASGIIVYMFNMPHRNVQESKTDYAFTSSQIVAEYLANYVVANTKYLADDGNSKIIEITGKVNNISDDFNGQKVVLIKGDNDKAGVSATFTTETNNRAENLNIGQIVTVKGVIRSGATYDEDLELYENVILEKSDVLN